MHRSVGIAVTVALLVNSQGRPEARQPRVAPGPSEPDWIAILDTMYGLRMFADLENPVRTTPEAVPGLFRKAGPGPVRYVPVIALGLETRNRGGWYRPGDDPAHPRKTETWNYQFKNTGHDLETGSNRPPNLDMGSEPEFDPGDRPFGLWVANDGLADGGVYTEPRVVAAVNQRVAKQPYKAMIYRYRDKATGRVVPHSYLIGWEYSTNDDFQDVVCRVDNVELVVGP
jgi:hypothetical protein